MVINGIENCGIQPVVRWLTMEYTTAKKITNILFAVGTVLLLSLFLLLGLESAAFNTIMRVAFLLAFGLYAAGIIITLKYYRCPHCHSLIRVRFRTPDYCPECGKAL